MDLKTGNPGFLMQGDTKGCYNAPQRLISRVKCDGIGEVLSNHWFFPALAGNIFFFNKGTKCNININEGGLKLDRDYCSVAASVCSISTGQT